MSDRNAAARQRPRRPALPMDSSVFFKLVRVVNLTARPFSESIGKAHRLSLNEWRVLLVLANLSGIIVVAPFVRAWADHIARGVARAPAHPLRPGRQAATPRWLPPIPLFAEAAFPPELASVPRR